MKTILRRALAIGAAIVGVGALSAWTATTAQPAGPIKIGVVDMQKMGGENGGLLEASEIQARLTREIAGLNARLEEVATQFTNKQKELQNFPERERTSPAYMKIWSEAVELEVQTRARKQALEKIFEQQKAMVTAEMYVKMQEGISEFARQEGFDLVLIDDRSTPVTAERGPEALAMMIQSKRIMFASPRLDITDQVVLFMNNRYRAGVRPPANGGGGPPPPPAPAATGATGSVTGPTIAPPSTGTRGPTGR
ncbi:MAG: OmpH family outer membrane protein [Phycisphaerales bacterium]